MNIYILELPDHIKMQVINNFEWGLVRTATENDFCIFFS